MFQEISYIETIEKGGHNILCEIAWQVVYPSWIYQAARKGLRNQNVHIGSEIMPVCQPSFNRKSFKMVERAWFRERADKGKKPAREMAHMVHDIFDVYGKLEELTIFTQAVERWDHEGLEKLPRYMKVCFEALDMITMDISMKVCESHGWNPTDSSKIGVHLVMLHVYFLLGEELTRDKVKLIESNPRIVSSAATILRLWDDLGSAKDENQDGIDGSYVECYLNEQKGSTVDEARTHVVQKISKAWKCLNQECLIPRPFSRSFSEACLNIARTVPLMYSYVDNQRLSGLDEYLKSLM
ncbi:unnamed protein product [Arabis nemorensis]|uniref:Terpene synthase metal-binding domain-containing protein n=1 Tax=Arabis nemorensis TaxID=586526 RepID=A0A565AWK7_9BRAS|nr:unnamed protein product [Arabis nemorensis]